MGKFIDLTGQRFERLVVIERSGIGNSGSVVWRCLCDCGKETHVLGTSLRMGNTRSCGCLIAESTSARARTHGLSKTRLYKIWDGMRGRCTNPNRREYKDYGGRGITVCTEWDKEFMAFHDWSMENGYSDNLTLDRIENDGPYSPENCRWATRKTQSDNTRLTVHITVNGETRNIEEWAATIGVARSTMSRHVKNGDAEEYISKRLK